MKSDDFALRNPIDQKYDNQPKRATILCRMHLSVCVVYVKYGVDLTSTTV